MHSLYWGISPFLISQITYNLTFHRTSICKTKWSMLPEDSNSLLLKVFKMTICRGDGIFSGWKNSFLLVLCRFSVSFSFVYSSLWYFAVTIPYYGNNLYYNIQMRVIGFEVFFAHYNYQDYLSTARILFFGPSSNLLLSERLGIFTSLLSLLSLKFSHYFRVGHGDYALS